MKLLIIFFSFILFSCKDKTNIKIPKEKTELISRLNDIRTQNGNLIKFKTSKNQIWLQWNQSGKFKTLDYSFDLNGSKAWLPKFIGENNKFIFFRAGCGVPCWTGFFLPLDKGKKAIIINEYAAYDLEQNYVAYFNVKDQLEVLNIETGNKQTFKTKICDAVFPLYCIDTLYFTRKKLCYKWITKNGEKLETQPLTKLNIQI